MTRFVRITLNEYLNTSRTTAVELYSNTNTNTLILILISYSNDKKKTQEMICKTLIIHCYRHWSSESRFHFISILFGSIYNVRVSVYLELSSVLFDFSDLSKIIGACSVLYFLLKFDVLDILHALKRISTL